MDEPRPTPGLPWSLRTLVEREHQSRYEGEVPEDVMQEEWVEQFLQVVLGESHD